MFLRALNGALILTLPYVNKNRWKYKYNYNNILKNYVHILGLSHFEKLSFYRALTKMYYNEIKSLILIMID